MNIQGFSPAMAAPMQAQSAKPSAASGTGNTSGSSGGTFNGTSASDLQSTFLNLLVTELQNQDPTQPVDPTQMVSQMVSLNQLDQLISINQALTTMTGSSTSPSTQAHGANAAVQSDILNAGSTTPAVQSNSAAQPMAFQGLPAAASTSNSGALMNLYGNIGALATTSNQFTAAGGR
jgi:flagellar basal-body rod modification protein FlgD